MTHTDNHKLPEWIDEQQKHSAQIEIIIASGFIFFLFQLPEILTQHFIEISNSTNNGSWFVIYVGAYIFARALLIGFTLILFLRAIWLAYLGINYSFPTGIDYKSLSFSEHVTSKMKRRNNNIERILLLERICSISYSITIIFTLLSIGVFLLTFMLGYLLKTYLPEWLPNDSGNFIFLFFFVLIGVFDYIFFKKLKKFSTIQKLYYPIHTFIRYISLSFLYDYEWNTLLSRIKRWKIYCIFIFCFFMSLIISISEIQKKFEAMNSGLAFLDYEKRHYLYIGDHIRINSSSYDDQLKLGEKVGKASISSDIIASNTLKLFTVYFKYYDTTLDSLLKKHHVNLDKKKRNYWFYEKSFSKNDSLIQNTLSDFFNVYIDDKYSDHLMWYYYKHPKTNQQGFLSYIPIDHLDKGRHKIDLKTTVLIKDSMQQNILESIHFFKE